MPSKQHTDLLDARIDQPAADREALAEWAREQVRATIERRRTKPKKKKRRTSRKRVNAAAARARREEACDLIRGGLTPIQVASRMGIPARRIQSRTAHLSATLPAPGGQE